MHEKLFSPFQILEKTIHLLPKNLLNINTLKEIQLNHIL